MIDYESALSGRVKGIAPSGIRKFFDLPESMFSSRSKNLRMPEGAMPLTRPDSADS